MTIFWLQSIFKYRFGLSLGSVRLGLNVACNYRFRNFGVPNGFLEQWLAGWLSLHSSLCGLMGKRAAFCLRRSRETFPGPGDAKVMGTDGSGIPPSRFRREMAWFYDATDTNRSSINYGLGFLS